MSTELLRPTCKKTDASQFFGVNQVDSISESLEPLSGWLIRRVFDGDYQLVNANELGPFPTSPTYL